MKYYVKSCFGRYYRIHMDYIAFFTRMCYGTTDNSLALTYNKLGPFVCIYFPSLKCFTDQNNGPFFLNAVVFISYMAPPKEP